MVMTEGRRLDCHTNAGSGATPGTRIRFLCWFGLSCLVFTLVWVLWTGEVETLTITTSGVVEGKGLGTFGRVLAQAYEEGGGDSVTGRNHDLGQNRQTRSAFSSGEQGGYISPKEYLVALYVVPLWLCLILICLRSTARWSVRRNGARDSLRVSTNEVGVDASGDSEGGLNQSILGQLKQYTFTTAAGVSMPDQPGQEVAGAGKDSGAKYQTTDCSVCMEAFEEGDRIRELPCGHIFHLECVDEVRPLLSAALPISLVIHTNTHTHTHALSLSLAPFVVCSG